MQDGEGKTPEDLAEAVKETEMVAFLQACAKGNIPAKAPATKVNFLQIIRQGPGNQCKFLTKYMLSPPEVKGNL
jgi:hypothetical protein